MEVSFMLASSARMDSPLPRRTGGASATQRMRRGEGNRGESRWGRLSPARRFVARRAKRKNQGTVPIFVRRKWDCPPGGTERPARMVAAKGRRQRGQSHFRGHAARGGRKSGQSPEKAIFAAVRQTTSRRTPSSPWPKNHRRTAAVRCDSRCSRRAPTRPRSTPAPGRASAACRRC